MEKSKRNRYRLIVIGYWLLVIGLLIYTRLVNLGWGLPYPMHPDERNMAIAIQGLNCDLRSKILNLRSCFNPHFFAYGQFPLYLGYILVLLMKFFDGDLGTAISFSEAVLSLRVISAIASMINFIIIIKIINIIKGKNAYNLLPITYLIIIFSPFFIQFSHFGTTESLLMLFYSLIIYYSLKILENEKLKINYLIITSLFSGLALSTKVSSIIFLTVPIISIISKIPTSSRSAGLRGASKYQRSKLSSNKKVLIFTLGFALCALIFAPIFSPHNLIHWREFISSVRYESDVALGRYTVFYTRQFIGIVPILFQLTKIFPYALGWPVLILGVSGVLGLSWRDSRINLLRLALLIYFLSNAFLFAKWTRFMAPILPLMLVFSVLFMMKIKIINVIKVIIILAAILPGIAYLSIYQHPDVRFTASEWIYKNVPNNSYLLSETANVVDIPLPVNSQKVHKVYKVISFDFYELDNSSRLQEELEQRLKLADYIIVPSRRIFSNFSTKQYPRTNYYYNNLFSGKLGFKQIAVFSSYPKISLFGKTLLEFPDENAEETWSVFDHPVIRIYKKEGKTL